MPIKEKGNFEKLTYLASLNSPTEKTFFNMLVHDNPHVLASLLTLIEHAIKKPVKSPEHQNAQKVCLLLDHFKIRLPSIFKAAEKILYAKNNDIDNKQENQLLLSQDNTITVYEYFLKKIEAEASIQQDSIELELLNSEKYQALAEMISSANNNKISYKNLKNLILGGGDQQ